MIRKSMVCVFCYTFRQYGYLPLIFVRSDIYQLKSAMRKNVFSYSRTSPAPVYLDSQNYNSTVYLVSLSQEIDFGRKYWGTKECILIPKNIITCGIEECEYSVHFLNTLPYLETAVFLFH